MSYLTDWEDRGSLERGVGKLLVPAVRHRHAVIIGAEKTATTMVAAALREHPGTDVPAEEFCGFADPNYDSGTSDALERQFTGGSSLLRVFKSAAYLGHHEVPERLARGLDVPELVVVLCDPIRRAVGARGTGTCASGTCRRSLTRSGCGNCSKETFTATRGSNLTHPQVGYRLRWGARACSSGGSMRANSNPGSRCSHASDCISSPTWTSPTARPERSRTSTAASASTRPSLRPPKIGVTTRASTRSGGSAGCAGGCP